MLELVLASVVAIVLATQAATYVGYPLSLALLTRLAWSAPEPATDDGTYPGVTMIVPVHNEADVIRRKVRNTADIDYPGSFRCLVVSDSTDDTDDRLQRAVENLPESEDEPAIELLSLDERRGKSHAINRALERLETPLVVFSDANTMYEPDAVSRLVAPLADPSVGCVTGKLHLRNSDGESGETAYWRYELWVRRLEARVGTTVSVNGALLAARSRDLDPLPETALTDDFYIAMSQARDGRRIHYEPDAVGTEYTTGSIAGEFERRVRIGAGNVQALRWFADLLRPRYGRLAFQFFGHKVLRWIQPWLLLVAGLATVAGALLDGSPPWLGLLILEVGTLVLAGIGLLSERAERWAPFRLPAFFLAMNAAFALGWLHAVSGRTEDVWGQTARGG